MTGYRRPVEPVWDWYCDTLARIDTSTAGDVIASWSTTFRPIAMLDAAGTWHVLSEPSGPLPAYDGPRPDLFRKASAGWASSVLAAW